MARAEARKAMIRASLARAGVIGAGVIGAAVIAACSPVALATGTVFLFAGPHNWLEARYFASRMPVRWGPSRRLFFCSLTGVAVLSATSIAGADRAIWHLMLASWLVALVWLGRRELSEWAVPAAFAWAGLAFASPYAADLALVFLHPIAALYFVRRQIAKSRPEWMAGFRGLSCAVGVLAVLILLAAEHGEMAVNSFAALQLPRPLLSLHAFFELLHYAGWIFLSAVGIASKPWQLKSIPLVRHRLGWPRLVTTILIAGGVVVAGLWVLFYLDFATTSHIYFSVAIVHVLMEVPLMIWLR